MRYSPTLARQQKLVQAFEDPALFSQFILGDDLWSKQREILQSVARYPRTAVKACHASGKTYIAAGSVLWWITRRLEAIAITTAPSWTQVERLLWGEIHSAVYRSKIQYPKPNASSLQLGPGRYAVGLSTNEGVRFQGFHGSVLVVLDEAPGVLPEIWEAIEGIRAGGDVRVLALGNPTVPSGPFYDAFTAHREGWNLITISAFDTPNLTGLTLEGLLQLSEEELHQDIRPYLTRRRWIKEKYQEWGPGHPLWESRVLGNFPQQSEDALLSLSWLEAAKYREGEDAGPWRAGLDVAGPGEDETVLCLRQGTRIVLLKAWASQDPRGEVLAALLPFRGRLEKINVDSVGIGYYLVQHLKDQGLPVEPVNVGERARDTEKYVNRKAELYWGLRERAQAGDLAGLTDEKAIAQLAGLRYSHNARGQVVIESKEDARKRGVKSPDRGEAIMLAFAECQPRYGLLEYLAAKDEEERESRTRARVDAQHGPKPPCPRCQCTGVTWVTQDWRCQLCGHQFGGQPVIAIPQVSRYDMLEGRFG